MGYYFMEVINLTVINIGIYYIVLNNENMMYNFIIFNNRSRILLTIEVLKYFLTVIK